MVDLFVTLSIWDSIMAAGSALMQPLYWAVSGLIVFFHWLFTPLLGADSGWTCRSESRCAGAEAPRCPRS